MRICHMTSAHPVKDVRIFYKECQTLQEMGLEVFLLAKSKQSDSFGGIHIVGLHPFRNRLIRIVLYPWIILLKAFQVNATVYHFHDPELLFIGLLLKLAGKKVIYDAHENVPLHVASKFYMIRPLRWFIAQLVKVFEEMGVLVFDGTIVATESIKKRFPPEYFHKIAVIRNFVDPSEIKPSPFQKKFRSLCYVGGISHNRGVDLLVKSIEETDVTLKLAGKFHNERYLKKIKKMKGWNNVNYLGIVNREEIKKLYDHSYMGLLLLRPRENFKDSLPIKMFEYMAAGIPVLASNFSLWKEMIEDNRCGVCVDPLDVGEVRKQIERLLADKALAEEMGRNGRALVVNKYNWHREKEKLKDFYTQILNGFNN